METETQSETPTAPSSRESVSEQSGAVSAESRKVLPRIASAGSELYRAAAPGVPSAVTASYSDFIAQQQHYQQQQRSLSGSGGSGLRHSFSWGSFVAAPPFAVGYGSGIGGSVPNLSSGAAPLGAAEILAQNAYLHSELNRAQSEIQALRNRIYELEMHLGVASCGVRSPTERASTPPAPASAGQGKAPGSSTAVALGSGPVLTAPPPLHVATAVPFGGSAAIPASGVGALYSNNRVMPCMSMPHSSSPLNLPAWRPDRFSPSPPPAQFGSGLSTSATTASGRAASVPNQPFSSAGPGSSHARPGLAAKSMLARHDSLGSISKDSHNSHVDEYGTGGYSSSSGSSLRIGERRRSQSSSKRRGRASSVGSAPETGTPQPRYWTQEEHQRFLEALEKFGTRNVRAISEYVGTRNATQVRTHAQKYFLRLTREAERKSSRP